MSKNNENKMENNYEEVYRSLGFFGSGTELSFIFKKTEKITQGLYLSTNHIKDSDSIKWLIRERAVDMLYSVIQMNSGKGIKIDILVEEYISISFEILSLLNTATGAFLINTNNSRILSEEILHVVQMIRKFIGVKSAFTSTLFVNNDFFKVDPISNRQEIGQPDVTSQSTGSQKSVIKSGADHEKVNKNMGINKDKKVNRQEQIIDLLKKQSGLTIKDFVKVISGCSEKTIQRELIALTKSGQVIKEGERRWSKYSLKN